LTFTGIADRRYFIETSEDLATWSTLTEIVTDTLPKRLNDPLESPRRFFRAR
jgi:hypothetical protein